MHFTMAVTCGVDICTNPQSAFQYNYISIFIILIQLSSYIYQLQIFQESISFLCWSVLTDIFLTNSNPNIHVYMSIIAIVELQRKATIQLGYKRKQVREQNQMT